MPGFVFKKSDRELREAAQGRPGVSAAARGYEEADAIVRRHDRRSEGGPAIEPVMITDERENDRVEMEGHARAVGEAGAEQVVMGRKRRTKTFFGPLP